MSPLSLESNTIETWGNLAAVPILGLICLALCYLLYLFIIRRTKK